MAPRYLLLFCLLIGLAACQTQRTQPAPVATVNPPTAMPTPDDPGVFVPRATPDLAQLPLLAAHLERVQQALQQPVPILALADGLDENQQRAQTIAIADPDFQRYTFDDETGAPLRNEVFGVYPVRDSDITEFTEACQEHACYRVEMYNYALNLYLAAVVDLDSGAVIDRIAVNNAQPDIPQELTDIALEIAVHSPEVADTLGYTPETSDALMANTKTALNYTQCERSRHLCVAPTFVIGEYAMWAIVDLTDGVLVGIRWTAVGSSEPAVTERTLQNDLVTRLYCEKDTALERDGWQLNYILTSSDGLRISDVTFHDTPILDSAKLIDWHVMYSSLDGFGYSDAVGCPVFSQAAVVAVEPPKVEDILSDGEVVGFALTQRFQGEFWPMPCNYRYDQRYEFYQDGRFRPIVINIGRGCGNDGIYRPVTRIALAGDYTFSEWDGAVWEDWQQEDWRLVADVAKNDDGYPFRLTNAAGGGYYIEPSDGQFGDGGRGDNPYLYVTAHHADVDEGDSDMPTIGPCCNEDYQQGPEKFIEPEPEPVVDTPLVVWYVPQIQNDDTPGSEYCWAEAVLEDGIYVTREYPCPSGPMFVPFAASQP